MLGPDEEPLDGGWQSEVARSGDVVYRSPKPQSATVHRLLDHLHVRGFDTAPRSLGFAADGREQLGFVEGTSPHPKAWTDEAVHTIGDLLRRLHRATTGFEPGPDAVWRPWFARDLPGANPVIGHGDLAPWNVLARDGLPVAIVDWDNAGPVDALRELAHVAWLNCQLHDDDVAALNELPPVDARSRHLALLVDGYGLGAADRIGFVDRMIEFAIRSSRDEAVLHDVGPETASPAADGFPLLWGVTWRARAAAWMLDHRRELELAIGV